MTDNKAPMWWYDGGFYDSPAEGRVKITREYWQELLEGESQGKRIADNEEGYPVLTEPLAPLAEELRESEIEYLKAKLTQTDWAVIKCAELGLPMAEQYPSEYAERIACRERINELENLGADSEPTL